MIRIGPFTIMRSRTHDLYRELELAAWHVHYGIWYPPDDDRKAMEQLTALDQQELAPALSQLPVEDSPS